MSSNDPNVESNARLAALVAQAQSAANSDNWERASRLARQILERDPNNQDAKLLLDEVEQVRELASVSESKRLIILVALPLISILFSVLSLIPGSFGGILRGAASLAGTGGLFVGGIVLIVQLVKGQIHGPNTLKFLVAWVLSILVFVGVVAS